MKKKLQEYRQIMVRPLDLAMCEYWDKGERLALPKQFKGLLYFDPLFVYRPKKAVTVYYNFTDPKQNLAPLIAFLEKDFSWFLRKKNEFDADCAKTRSLIKKTSTNIQRLSSLTVKIWPTIAVANVLGSTEVYGVKKKLRDSCIKIRNESDDVLHPALACLSRSMKEKISAARPGLAPYQPYVSFSEFSKANIPGKKTLMNRSAGYLFHKGNIFLDEKNYLVENGIFLADADSGAAIGDSITGMPATRCSASGKAKIIIELSDLDKIGKGDIIVAPMTTPDMILALKAAGGIVTDEGGITCHAAIISRELKKPCVIGTRTATKFIKDGDFVEINGKNGQVKITRKIS